MTWLRRSLHALSRQASFVGLLLILALTAQAPAGAAVEDDEEIAPQAWLLTYGPGEIYWQRFGHNAIWIRDPSRRLNHTFNFGFFDFEQEGFLGNFLLGRLNYFAAARPAEVELSEYLNQDRSIRAQRLDLTPEQLEALTQHLLSQVSMENREYLYDYYRNNCSTRIRDSIDLALDGAVGNALTPEPAQLNFRDHTRRLTAMDYWLYLGLEAGLGSPVDRAVTRWDEMFIPGLLTTAVQGITNPQTGRPLVIEDVMFHQSSLTPPPDAPKPQWLRYLLAAALLIVFAAAMSRFVPWFSGRRFALAWLMFAALPGAVLAFFWLFTDHWASALNLNLLLMNPLWLLLAVPVLRRPLAWLVFVCGLLALAAPWLPPAQYNADVVALVLPLNLVSAWLLLRRPSGPDLRQ